MSESNSVPADVPETDFGDIPPVGWLEAPFGAFRANLLHKIDFPSQLLDWKVPLYAQPFRASVPLAGEQILEGFCKTPHMRQYVEYFSAGVRFAERAHGITQDPA